MKNINLIFLEKYRKSFLNVSSWYVGKSSLGLEWIIPYLDSLHYETNYINPNILNDPDLSNRSKYIFENCKKKINKKKINLLITTINDSDISKKHFEKLKKLGIYTINIQNDSWNNQFCFQKINSLFDLQWLPFKPSNYQYKLLKKNYIKFIELPWAGIPYDLKNLKKNNKVLFYGSKNNSREYLIHQLANKKIAIDIYGGGWNKKKHQDQNFEFKSSSLRNQSYLFREPFYFKRVFSKIKLLLFKNNYKINKDLINKIHHFKGYISHDERVKILSNYLISVGSSAVGSTYVLKNTINISRGRDWELSGMGIMMVTPKDEILRESFIENEEMVFYENIDDLSTKLRFYLDNPDLAIKIGKNARKRIIKEHNFDLRIKTIIKKILNK